MQRTRSSSPARLVKSASWVLALVACSAEGSQEAAQSAPALPAQNAPPAAPVPTANMAPAPSPVVTDPPPTLAAPPVDTPSVNPVALPTPGVVTPPAETGMEGPMAVQGPTEVPAVPTPGDGVTEPPDGAVPPEAEAPGTVPQPPEVPGEVGPPAPPTVPAEPVVAPPAVDPWFENWPQAGGPHGSWRVEGEAPAEFSVALDKNILWKSDLPGGGQSGIAVWEDYLFLTTFEPYKAGASKTSGTIMGHAVDANSGAVLWSVRLVGSTPSPMMYSFSDSTSWSPITDGEHVWFFNSSGEMGCFDFEGNEVWRREFESRIPFDKYNKQHEPFLAGDTIVSVERLQPSEPGYTDAKRDWNYLRGIDKRTGEISWTSQDAITHYATSVAGRLPGGGFGVVHGRGGPHSVPERPLGLSLTNLAPGHEGESMWRFNEPSSDYEALYTFTWDNKYAYTFRLSPQEAHLVLDIETGELVRTQSLISNVDVRQWDLRTERYVLQEDVNIRDIADSPAYNLGGGSLHVHPNWHTNLAVDGYHYFTTMTNNRRWRGAPAGHSGPAHSVGRVNVESGKVEFLEVPVAVDAGKRIYGRTISDNKVLDSNGVDISGNARSYLDGWEAPAFFTSPTAVGNVLYLSGMLGIVYAIQTDAEVLDEDALLSVSDLGAFGSTWSLSAISYSDGKLYHRTSAEIIAIGQKP